MDAVTHTAYALLSQMRAAEYDYLQTIRWIPEMWVERHLSPARLKIYDLLLRQVAPDAVFTDDEHLEDLLREAIDALAWMMVWSSAIPVEDHIPVILAKFPRAIRFAVPPAFQDEHP